MNSSALRGILWMLLTTLLFVLVTAIVRFIGDGIPASQAAFIRYVIGTIILLPFILPLIKQSINKKDLLINTVEQIEHSLKSINGTYDITKPLSKLKKELKRKSLNIGRIEKNSSTIISAYKMETAWRKMAKETHLDSLRSLEELIRGNIGLRKQPQIPKEQAKEILYCQTFHKDLSLYF